MFALNLRVNCRRYIAHTPAETPISVRTIASLKRCDWENPKTVPFSPAIQAPIRARPPQIPATMDIPCTNDDFFMLFI